MSSRNMTPDSKDAPGVLSFSGDDYKLDDTVVEHIDASSPITTKSADRKRSTAANLPGEVIEQILYLTDPETFASLVLVNRAWRKASEDPKLYAHHLSRCPSYSASHSTITGPYNNDSLLKFKRLLVLEAKRHLFEVFMRPQRTVINLISTTTSSSAAFPYGEKFEFTFSTRAQFCLAISSSRIIVLDMASEDVSVRRELKVVRRPLSATILCDGTRLAVLSTAHKVNVYDLSKEKPTFCRMVELAEASHAIALSLHAEVLAAANEGGVEVVSLGENALPTEKRGVKCDRVDHLSFSSDGTMLLGTTQNSKSPSSVVFSAPYFTDVADHDMDHAQLISHMWTSQIIFPNSSRDCSHAALLPRKNDHNSNWTLTYDRTFESFRAVRTDDLRNGTTYFTGPNPPNRQRQQQRQKSALVPGTLPTITPEGELVAAAFLGAEIWLYGVPEDLDNTGVKYENARPGILGSSSVTSGSPTQAEPEGEHQSLPRWQVLVDKYRNVFAKGRRVANVAGVTNIAWHTTTASDEGPQYIKERLIIAAPGGVSGSSDLEQEEMASVDGGRLVCLDFNWTPQVKPSKEITLEVGSAEPELLEEEDTDMATEIAIVRRRTFARREGLPRSMVSSVADVLRPAGEEPPPVPPVPTSVGFGLDHTANDTAPAQSSSNVEDNSPPSPASSEEGVTLEEAAQAFDGPYSHTDPRSRNTLYRSATAVEASRRRAPQTIPTNGRVEYRRTDGTELPHESDADNWVPPPPPYTKEAQDTLPHHLRHILMSQSSISALPDSAAETSNAQTSPPAPAVSHTRASTSDAPVHHTRPLSSASSIHRRASSAEDSALGRANSIDATVAAEGTHHTIPRRPVARTNLSNMSIDNRPLSTITDTSSRGRSVAEMSNHGVSGSSWLSRHQSNRSPSPDAQGRDSSRPASYRHSHSPSAPSTPSSRSPSSMSRRPLSSYEPRSSLYRAALQPASSISPIQEPIVPAPTQRPSSRMSTSSARRSTSLTLSGSNLQQRLDYPLPPPPEAPVSPEEETPVSRTPPHTITTSPREISPPPAHPAVRPPLTHQASSAITSPPPHPAVRPTPSPAPRPPPAMTPIREPSAYQLTQLQIQSLPPPPPIPESPTQNLSRRRSTRFRLSLRSGGSRRLSRAASALSLRQSEPEPQPPRQPQLVSAQTVPVAQSRPESRAQSIKSKSKNRLSRRFSRLRGEVPVEDDVPPVPALPSGVASSNNARQSTYGGRGRRPEREYGAGSPIGTTVSVSGGGERTGRGQGKREKDGKCLVM